MKPEITTPTISAMMPAYNEEAVIGEAIQSILDQTYEDWELIIVDDGSTDGTPDVVACFDDPRIRYIRQENRGRGAARNTVLQVARGRYIAITDADDVSLPTRFENEVDFLETHPEVGILSAQVKYFSSTLEPTVLFAFPVEREAIRARFDRGVMGVAHAACILRRTVFDTVGMYATECLRAQDSELCLRAADHFEFANLPEVLVHYRSDPRSIGYRGWTRTYLFHNYAMYRHRRWRLGETPDDFKTWRKNPSVWLRILTWDTLRFLRFKALCHASLSVNRRPIHLQ